ncbi:MAG: condensation domain-containing protein [Chitinophagaceae bacterium]
MDNKAIHILQSARRNGLFISVNNEQLSIKFSKEKNIDPKLLEEIKDNKELIIDFLNNKKSKSKTSGDFEIQIAHIAKDSTQQFPLSFSQERLWFIDQLEGSVQYHVPVIRRLKGRLNKEALAHALHNIVNRHEVLRTVIIEKEGRGVSLYVGYKWLEFRND